MIYLGLATLCSASIVLIFKVTESKGYNRYLVTMSNYIVATLISVLMILGINGKITFSPSLQIFNRSGELSIAQVNSSIVMYLGILTGCFFLLGFVYYQKSVKEAGASLAGMFGKLGILLPMLLSIIIWREVPTPIQWVGILMALSAIVMVNLKSRSEKVDFAGHKALVLMGLFLFGGMGDFFNKIFQKYVLVDYKPYFLMFVFGTALILSIGIVLKNKYKLKSKDMLMGVAVGIPNLFASFFLIEALRYHPATVVFPIYSAGSILLITIFSVLFFKEKICRKEKIAMAMTVVSLLLINF